MGASATSHASAGVAPLRSAQRRNASRRGSSIPALASAVSTSASTVRSCSEASTICTGLLPGRQTQSIDEFVDLAIDHVGQIVERETDAMIGDTALREVVGADL